MTRSNSHDAASQSDPSDAAGTYRTGVSQARSVLGSGDAAALRSVPEWARLAGLLSLTSMVLTVALLGFALAAPKQRPQLAMLDEYLPGEVMP